MNRLQACFSWMQKHPVASTAVALLLVLMLLATLDEPSTDSASVPVSPYVAVARGRVDVEGGIIQLAAQRDGVAKVVKVEEGDSVHKGQVLAVLEDQQARLNVTLAENELMAAAAQVAQYQVEKETATREAKRLEDLLKDNAVARIEWERARDQVQLADARLQSAQAMHAAAHSRVRIAGHEVELRTVRAPFDGRIVRRQVRPGDGVSTLNVTPLFWFAPQTPRIVRAELEDRFVAMVVPGMLAEVVLETDSTRIYSARVTRVGILLGPKRPITDDSYERADVRVVECVLSLESAAQDLLLGQRVLVRFNKGP